MNASEQMDPTAFGLESHYDPDLQQRIRRLMLEDWKPAGVKLPTYMKLVARYVAPVGLPESWLARISHQTMDKMLKSISTPRYEFWACLHAYLARKYGRSVLTETPRDEIEALGDGLAAFAGLSELPRHSSGTYQIGADTTCAFSLLARPGEPFFRVHELRRLEAPFQTQSQRLEASRGVAVLQDGRLVLVLRRVTDRGVSDFTHPADELTEASDPELAIRLKPTENHDGQ